LLQKLEALEQQVKALQQSNAQIPLLQQQYKTCSSNWAATTLHLAIQCDGGSRKRGAGNTAANRQQPQDQGGHAE
jgi:hypothetical protein